MEGSQRPLFPQWSHHVYPQFLPGSHPNHQAPSQVVIQQQHHQHYHQQMQQQHHLSNANNNYINSNAGMMNANISPILHNNHIINNNHQHLHQTNMNFGGQMLNNDIQNATYYQQQHPFIQHQRSGDGMLINNTMASGTNGVAHIKNRNRLMKNNGLNNNFYRSSGTNEKKPLFSSTFLFASLQHRFTVCVFLLPAVLLYPRIFYDFFFVRFDFQLFSIKLKLMSEMNFSTVLFFAGTPLFIPFYAHLTAAITRYH